MEGQVAEVCQIILGDPECRPIARLSLLGICSYLRATKFFKRSSSSLVQGISQETLAEMIGTTRSRVSF